MRFAPLLAFTDGDQWRPGIGDPTVAGWITVAAYAVAALLCWKAAAHERRTDRARFLFWSFLSGTMILLGINKQLDLQTWFTLTARRLAITEGWYERRRLLQAFFIFAVAVGGIAGFAALWRLVQHCGRDLWLPLVGFFIIICFVIVRAASFHHVDQFLHLRLVGMKMNWILELGGISIIALGAHRLAQRPSGLTGRWLQDA